MQQYLHTVKQAPGRHIQLKVHRMIFIEVSSQGPLSTSLTVYHSHLRFSIIYYFRAFLDIDHHTDGFNSYTVGISYLQIYNECISDLLVEQPPQQTSHSFPHSTPFSSFSTNSEREKEKQRERKMRKDSLPLREDAIHGVFVEGLTEWPVTTQDQVSLSQLL